MAGKTITDLQLGILKAMRRYYEEPERYVEEIKAVVRKRDQLAKIILFGSYIKGDMKPDSDIDVLVITELAKNVDERVKLRMEVKRRIGELTPFEIHIVTGAEYENWYRKFIDKYLEY